MINKSIYKNIILAKNDTEIPVLEDGRTVDSKYNPENDAKRITETLPEQCDFIIQIGIGSGVLTKELICKFPKAVIICIENNSDDISFLSSLKNIKELSNNKNIIFSTSQNIIEDLLNNYVPSFYNNLQIVENKAWCMINQESYSLIKQNINYALKLISADFSVQCHFGKIWMSNILNNLKKVDKCTIPEIKIDTSKTAVILAAGPSLDESIKLLEKENNYFVIATDTAFSVLRKKNLSCDAVISIDAQTVSHNHFFNSKKYKDTLFIFDLCSDKSAVNYAVNHNLKTVFACTGHPLSTLAYLEYKDNFLNLYNGSGTVTITALDFAVKAGFSKINVFGADFSYNKKPYTKGVYLDDLYSKESSKIINSEKLFNKLMYRTPLENENSKKTTSVLKSYRDSFENYLSSQNYNYKKENEIYSIKIKNENTLYQLKNIFNYNAFLNNFKFIEKEITSIKDLTKYDISLLPLNSWQKKFDNSNKKNFTEMLKYSYSFIEKYKN